MLGSIIASVELANGCLGVIIKISNIIRLWNRGPNADNENQGPPQRAIYAVRVIARDAIGRARAIFRPWSRNTVAVVSLSIDSE
ncbi:hypothetical protein TWF281_011403 [Arthrobotrys megalospora]